MQEYSYLFERLLARHPITIDPVKTRAAIANKTVLITGAGGSIGSTLCVRILQHGPKRLVLLDSSEQALYQTGMDLGDSRSDQLAGIELTPRLGDVCDSQFLDKLFQNTRPDLVFHCAAYKHVSLLEYQPHAAIRNNTIGTYRLAAAALNCEVPRVVMPSTDKAVNPAGIMGASKRLAELILMGLSTDYCRMTSIRLVNVLGSQGSVAPRFARQIRERKPLTVTDRLATRYFLTPVEAAELVLGAAWMGSGADILVPDMGEPVRILDLAREMIAASGINPTEQPPIVFTGLGPGEKLCEELLARHESAAPVIGSTIRRIGKTKPLARAIHDWVSRLNILSQYGDAAGLIDMICSMLPEYRPGQVPAGDSCEIIESAPQQ